MKVVATNLLSDNKYGLIYRVGSGAALSTIDTVTDIYTIYTYFKSDALVGQAAVLLAMLATNMIVQLLVILAQYKSKSLTIKFREALICLSFLRPAVDAYRVSTNHKEGKHKLK